MSGKNGKKILHIGYASFAKAGIQTVIMNIARGIHEEFDVDVLLTSNAPGYYDEEFQKYGRIFRVDCSVEGFGRLKRLLHFAMRPFRQYSYAKKLIKENKYDVVHIHSGLEGGPMFLAARAAGARNIIAHSHTSASNEKRSLASKIYRSIGKRIIHRHATLRIGVSSLANSFLYGKDESIIINNPVEIDNFALAERKRQEGRITLANVGRYNYQKNQSFAIDVLRQILSLGYDAELLLVGFGKDEHMLREKIEKSALCDRVRMIRGDGNADIPAILGASDVFIFPSRYEGLGIAAIEAQAAGCLCVCSDAVPKETDLGMCKYLSLDSTAVEWAKEILNMIKEREKYKLDEQRARLFDEKCVQEEFCELYRKLCGVQQREEI